MDKPTDAADKVTDPRPLVAFLYLLGRDHLPFGTIEDMLDQCAADDGYQFNDDPLIRWAQGAADRLAFIPTEPPEAT